MPAVGRFHCIFLTEGFGEKCKQTELALNIIQNIILVEKTHFPFIIVKLQHREPANNCF